MTTIRATPLARDALQALIETLEAAGLPTVDVLEGGRRFFRFDDRRLVGFAGIEGRGPDCLLRSVVVVASRRGTGVGAALIEALETQAAFQGIERLHLLTATARAFFERCGYRMADRTTAPAAVASSAEFRSLCPASASYLVKTIGRVDAAA